MNRHRLRVVAVAVVSMLVLVACAGSDDEPGAVTIDVPETVAIGVLPDPLTDQPTLPPPPSPPTSAVETPSTSLTSVAIEGPVGDNAQGDRILFIGDATLASAAPPNDSRMCDSLTLFGWDAELDTVSSDDLTFVEEVLDARLLPDDDLDWDVLGLFVGNQLPPDQLAVTELTDVLDAAIERVAPRPVVLFTLTETDPSRERLNEVIRERPDVHPNVVVIDWAVLGGNTSDVLADDGVSLTDDGLKRLPLQTAAAFGQAPDDQDGECLDPVFPLDDED